MSMLWVSVRPPLRQACLDSSVIIESCFLEMEILTITVPVLLLKIWFVVVRTNAFLYRKLL